MAKRTRRRCGPAADPDTVLARLRSPDPRTRVNALHAICPCGAGFPLYERFRREVKRLQKDPDPATLLDGAAEQGWRYSDNDWVSKHRQRQATRQWLPL